MWDWLEYEEQVGRIWHRLVGDAVSYPRHEDAAVAFESVRGGLGVFFRGVGGTPGLALAAGTPRSSGHRLRLRQRIGLERERVEAAERNPERVLLPTRIAYFPAPELNRQLYLWLAAFFAAAPEFFAEPPREDEDPLRADLALLRSARRTSGAVCDAYPGLAAVHRELCTATLAARPRRRLPPVEAAVEEVVVALLGGRGPEAAAGRVMLLAVTAPPSSPLTAFGAPRRYRRFLPVPLWGEVTPCGGAADGPEGDEPDHGATRRREEDEDSRARRARRRRQDQTERSDPLALINKGEMLLLPEELVNVSRPLDDEEKDAARQAAEDMEALTLTGHERRAASRLRLDLDLPAARAADDAPLPPSSARLLYPEWSCWRKAYRNDHCAVLVDTAAEEGEDWRPDAATRRRIALVRRRFEALRPRREVLPRQLDGGELDLDAVVRARSDLRASGVASDRLYRAARQRARDLAVAILIDVSLSTDSWIDNRRVLDVAKEALTALALGLAACGDGFAVHTFTSRRRGHVRVATVKDFDEPMGGRVLRRIAALRPGEYTRMGAAIRHARTRLAGRPERHRLLLLLTDGKPHDIDHYEGRYGAEDTRRAVAEARAGGVAVFAITIDRRAREYVPYLFGRGGYAIVSRIDRLSRALPMVYHHLVG